jgi:CubicO group peptidase (beta-lactamase class C family)
MSFGATAQAARYRHAAIATLAIAAGAHLGCGTEPEAPSASAPAEPMVERFLEEALPADASGTFALASGDEVVHCQGVGDADRANGLAAGCDTVYDISSMTKQFTAAAILKLQMMGELEVADRIGEHLGPVPADKRAITIDQLLTHTSGLTAVLGDDYEPLGRDQMVRAALRSDLRSAPGAEHRYSNLGYSVLAAIVEEASGVGYEEFLARNLFAPAGMTQTGYVLPEWDPEQVAIEYDERGRPHGRPYDHPWAGDGPYWNLRGNGGLLSTAADMLRWHVALDGDEVLDAEAKRLLFAPHVAEGHGSPLDYGYGWSVTEMRPFGRLATHNGGNNWSYGRVARFLDEGTMVFWVTNRAYRPGGWSFEQLDRRLTMGLADLARPRA